jgi:gliding motility-associated-like protein
MKLLIQWVCLLLLSASLFAQSGNVNNIGFEEGTLSGWTFTNGTVSVSGNKLVYSSERPGVIPTRLELLDRNSGNELKISNENIKKVRQAAGNNYGIRLGQDDLGGTYERAKTEFVVQPDRYLLQFYFVALLEEDNNSRHIDINRPGMSIKLYNSANVVIPCGDFDVQLSTSKLLNGFKYQGSIQYKDWTTASIDLKNYVGQKIKLELTVHGCTGRSHFGYCYFDAEFLRSGAYGSDILALSECPDPNGMMSFKAPDGFDIYKWSDGQRTQLISTQVNKSTVLKVETIPFSALNQACTLPFEYKLLPKNGARQVSRTICEGEQFRFFDSTYNLGGSYVQLVKRAGICDTLFSLDLTVNPLLRTNRSFVKCLGEKLKIGDSTFTKTGNYSVRVKSKTTACDSIYTVSAVFEKFKLKPLNNLTLTYDDSLFLVPKLDSGSLGQFSWHNGKDSLLCLSCPVFRSVPTKADTYTLKAKDAAGVCYETSSFKLNLIDCDLHFPTAFSPNADGINDMYGPVDNPCISEVKKLEIYDRWGSIIFQKLNYVPSDPNLTWNGLKSAIKAPFGTYFFQAQYKTTKGKTLHKKGSFFLME